MYIINVTEVDTGAQFQYTSINTQYTLRSLHPYYTYEFVIEAVTVTPGPPTLAFSIQTSQDGKCPYEYIYSLFFKNCHHYESILHVKEWDLILIDSHIYTCVSYYAHVY